MTEQQPNSQRDPQPDSDLQSEEQSSKEKAPGLLSVFQSVLAAMFGVQSDEKRQQDFAGGNATNFIVVGIIMVVIFIFTLITIVNSILEQ